tara:strand:+ start:1642 stop:2148 length:507 start_codon:yes stop_codon:yes gene_type:complete
MSTLKVDDIQSRQSTDDAISLASDSSVSLKHSGSAKLATTSTGVDITGTCTATSVTAAGGTFTGGITVDAINDTVFTITDASSVALDPDNGMVQTWTLGANRTATDSLTTGQSMLLVITASSSNYTLTWPTMTWSGGSAPTLGGATPTAIVLWKISSTLYGATVGDLG